jgi:Homeodomain-like domain
MTTARSRTSSPQLEGLRGDEMRTPDEVAAMLRLSALGWGTKRIAAELGCSRNTVKRYVEAQGWAAYRTPRRPRVLAGLEVWLAKRFRQHRGMPTWCARIWRASTG